MKAAFLKRKAIRNYVLTAALFAAFAGVIFLSSYENKLMSEKVITIDNEISKIKEDYDNLQSKSADIKKYVNMWDTIHDNKKVISGIKLDDITSLVAKTSERYFVTDTQIKVSSIPQLLQGGIFSCKTVAVIFTKVSITFLAVTDVKALMFIDDLFSRIPGYGVITSLEIKKSKDYSVDDLVRVSSGRGGNVAGKVDFIWYAYRSKEASDNIPVKSDQTDNQ